MDRTYPRTLLTVTINNKRYPFKTIRSVKRNGYYVVFSDDSVKEWTDKDGNIKEEALNIYNNMLDYDVPAEIFAKDDNSEIAEYIHENIDESF